MALPVIPPRPVNVIIKTPPVLTGLTPVTTYTSPKSAVATAIYSGLPPQDITVAVAPIKVPNANAVSVSPQTTPVTYYYTRNNRVVGPFNSIAETQLAIEWHISREIELGADI